MANVTVRILASMAALTVILPLAIDTGANRTADPAQDADIPASPHPTIAVSGGTNEMHDKLDAGLQTFRDAGLELPSLVVRLSVDEASCAGHRGRFRDSTTPWEITICSTGDAVYEHELAHAWERSTLSDEQRATFMKLRGHEVWSSPEVPWNERGVEGVAFVIQQGLADVPLSPVLSDEARSRMRAYEFLTGMPAPRLARWMILRDIPCSDRPTPLSRLVPDKSDLTC